MRPNNPGENDARCVNCDHCKDGRCKITGALMGWLDWCISWRWAK